MAYSPGPEYEQEAMAARFTLRKGVETYLGQLGVNPGELRSIGTDFDIRIGCNSEYSRQFLPGNLVTFIDEQYHPRKVNIVGLTVSPLNILVRVYPNNENIEGTNETNLGDLGENLKWSHGVLVPPHYNPKGIIDLNSATALSSTVELKLDENPMSFGILGSKADEWMEYTAPTKIETDTEGFIIGNGNLKEGPLDPGIVMGIASILPDNQAAVEEKQKPFELRDWEIIKRLPDKQVILYQRRFDDDIPLID